MTAKKNIIIGTRGSDLALWQADYLQSQLNNIGCESTIKIIKTRGDQIQSIGFSKMEGKGFFTKEIEEELLNGTIDVAVHSMKDLPTTQPDGLCLAGVSYRENPADVLFIKKSAYDESAPLRVKAGTVIGTSSARRKAMIADLNPNVTTMDIRGNVPTRVQKLIDSENLGAIVLAAAGVTRLELEYPELVKIELHPREFIPAPAQGVLAFQTREDDLEMRKVIAKIHNKETATLTNIERTVLNRLDGGCQLPLGVYAHKDQLGFYHAYSALYNEKEGKMRRFKLSQSTYVGLADAIYNELTK